MFLRQDVHLEKEREPIDRDVDVIGRQYRNCASVVYFVPPTHLEAVLHFAAALPVVYGGEGVVHDVAVGRVPGAP